MPIKMQEIKVILFAFSQNRELMNKTSEVSQVSAPEISGTSNV